MHRHGALGMAMAPNGHLLVSNSVGINPDASQPSEILEFTTDGNLSSSFPLTRTRADRLVWFFAGLFRPGLDFAGLASSPLTQ
jgi:hypothetical protein